MMVTNLIAQLEQRQAFYLLTNWQVPLNLYY